MDPFTILYKEIVDNLWLRRVRKSLIEMEIETPEFLEDPELSATEKRILASLRKCGASINDDCFIACLDTIVNQHGGFLYNSKDALSQYFEGCPVLLEGNLANMKPVPVEGGYKVTGHFIDHLGNFRVEYVGVSENFSLSPDYCREAELRFLNFSHLHPVMIMGKFSMQSDGPVFSLHNMRHKKKTLFDGQKDTFFYGPIKLLGREFPRMTYSKYKTSIEVVLIDDKKAFDLGIKNYQVFAGRTRDQGYLVPVQES